MRTGPVPFRVFARFKELEVDLAMTGAHKPGKQERKKRKKKEI